jgi:hypothetical protein
MACIVGGAVALELARAGRDALIDFGKQSAAELSDHRRRASP